MASEFVAFLRGISNVPMQAFRDALVEAGLQDVRSYGGTGNLLFSGGGPDRTVLEERIAAAVGVETFVRSRPELAGVVSGDPFVGEAGAAIFFAHDTIEPRIAASFVARGFEGQPPVIVGSQVYFVHPLQRPGRKASIDLERELGIRGTMRASRVVARVLEIM